jgi:Protein of unknown function (DUF4238)
MGDRLGKSLSNKRHIAMKSPKLHHYVPQFYLRRFTDAGGQLWVWDKVKDAIFQTNPKNVAAENDFYAMKQLADAGHDPYTMERQLSEIEADVSLITGQWLDWFIDLELGKRIEIPLLNREIIALFIALQYLRTADTRDILSVLGKVDHADSKERTRLHTNLLWDLPIVHRIRDRIKGSIWIFGRNETETPFITSDNPIAFKTRSNRQWSRVSILSPGMYAVYPLSPTIVMYCHDGSHPEWEKLAKWDDCLSPIEFTEELVESDNCGQVFMSSRFVFSRTNDFEMPRDFADAIATNRYAPKEN